MYLEELIDLVVIVKLSTAISEMLNPVQTCIFDLWGKKLLKPAVLYTRNKHPRSIHATDVFLKRARQKPYTAASYCLMCLFFVHPE